MAGAELVAEPPPLPVWEVVFAAASRLESRRVNAVQAKQRHKDVRQNLATQAAAQGRRAGEAGLYKHPDDLPSRGACF